jgi:predicted GH43/DUF377 family glycosyl hydrolase
MLLHLEGVLKRFLILIVMTILFHLPVQGLGPRHNLAELMDPAILSVKKIEIEGFEEAYNPSIIETEQGPLLSFRITPFPDQLNISYIGVVLLDEHFDQISKPQILDTRAYCNLTPSQSEDARLISYQGKIFLCYNDNVDELAMTTKQRRDIFLAELLCDQGQYSLAPSLKLIHMKEYKKQLWQKNWVPFEWKDKLLMSYTVNPHEVIVPGLKTGLCAPVHLTKFNEDFWRLGQFRGGTPAQLVNGEYLALFHTGCRIRSEYSKKNSWHYFMGAYTFSSEPPFEITRITPVPLTHETFYHVTKEKKVIFPGGFIVREDALHFVYGKDDHEVWVGTLSLEQLNQIMVPVR